MLLLITKKAYFNQLKYISSVQLKDNVYNYNSCLELHTHPGTHKFLFFFCIENFAYELRKEIQK